MGAKQIDVINGIEQMHDVLDLLPDPFKPKRGLVRPRSSSTKVEATSGWKLDAHKNLPGLKLLYETFPLSPFYMLVDDDTYIFGYSTDSVFYYDNTVGNLIDKVTAIDPEKAAWFGSRLHDCPLGDVRVSRCLQLYTSAKFYPSREHQSRYVDQADENMNWLMKDAPITSGSNACT
ncbi:hypothetical protein SARC_05549 [Sphaeroforma arctica JP610]|uniref:Uncharacterized protein n=1 Tax=Sphaeroforma arctica JP610 TaxID=667725 RepID=A0A0L0G1V3_9EUKA|nr:hypothetical protein SARC_05549 [Sphaeroforma arctica JP610]KNC82168.1 hypothetical protein SARC_05549 [Sphaeroforma arctica JP610]|eukprot:XP_014156070.1 hypothetical protein SARC_05549 [Sphaeroforma arctica JP610]